MSKRKQLSLDDVPEIMSKFLGILNAEAERIEQLPEADRKPSDIKTAVSCLTALNAINKDTNTEVFEYRKQINLLPVDKVQAIVAAQHEPLRLNAKED